MKLPDNPHFEHGTNGARSPLYYRDKVVTVLIKTVVTVKDNCMKTVLTDYTRETTG